MNCKACGAEVANIGQLNKHKKDCQAKSGEVKQEPILIPYDLFKEDADLISIYRTNGIMYIKVECIKRADAVEVTQAWLMS